MAVGQDRNETNPTRERGCRILSESSDRPDESPETPKEVVTTYKEKRFGKSLIKITVITEHDPEAVQRANDYVVECLLNRLPELLAKYGAKESEDT